MQRNFNTIHQVGRIANPSLDNERLRQALMVKLSTSSDVYYKELSIMIGHMPDKGPILDDLIKRTHFRI